MNPATGLPEFQQDYPDEFYIPDSSEGGYYPPNMPLESQGGYRMEEGEYSTEPPGPTYTALPYVPMSNLAQSSEPYFMNEQVQVPEPNLQQASSPYFMDEQILPPFRPSMDYGEGMTGAAIEAYDRGLPRETPSVRELADMAKSGAKQVFEGLKTPGGAALANALMAGIQARRGFKQARAMEGELRQLGQAPRQVGQEQLGAGMRGELTPVQRQQIAAFQAQQRQALANTGQRSGTAQQQLAARTTEMQQRGAQDLINQGLKNIGISDKYLQQAILAGYEADSRVGTALSEALRASGKLLAGEASNEVDKPVQTPATQQRRTALSSPLGG
jgi:hypothetical protein